MAVNIETLDQYISDELESTSRLIANAEAIWAKIGNGENPPDVLVLASQSPDGKAGWFYCYRQIDRSKEVLMVKNTYPGIAYSDASAGLDVLVGYPPKSNTLSILGINPALINQQTGGLLPSQSADLEAANFTPDRLKFNNCYTQGTLVLGFYGGTWKLGTQDVYSPPNSSFLDVTSYIPSTSSKSKWLRVGINDSNGADVVQSQEFDSAYATPSDYMPLGNTPGVLRLGWALLTQGMTILDKTDWRTAPDMFTALPDSLSGGAGEFDSLAVDGTEENTINQQSEGTPLITYTTTTVANGTPTEKKLNKTVNTTDATATVIYEIDSPADGTYTIEWVISGKRTGGAAGGAVGDTLVSRAGRVFKCVSGTVSSVGSWSIGLVGEAWGGISTHIVGTTKFQIKVTGAANIDIQWHAHLTLHIH